MGNDERGDVVIGEEQGDDFITSELEKRMEISNLYLISDFGLQVSNLTLILCPSH